MAYVEDRWFIRDRVTGAKVATARNGQGQRWRGRHRDAAGVEHARHFPLRKDADRWVTEQATRVGDGSWTDPRRARVRVREWAQQWLGAQAHLKPSTRARYASLLRAQVLPEWGEHTLGTVTHADVATWVSKMSAKGLAPASVRQAHRVLSLLLALAVRDGRVPRNVAEGVPLPRARRADPRPLTRAQLSALVVAAGQEGDVIALLAGTGLRFGEAAGLRVRRVDLGRRRLHVVEAVTEVGGVLHWGTPKTHQQRTVPIPAALVDSLALRCASREGDETVLTSPEGGPLRLGNFRRRVFDPAARAAGIEGLSPHDLRATAASTAISAGANPKAVQRLLGHASAAMTLDRYSALFSDDLDTLAERMDSAAADYERTADRARATAGAADRAGSAPALGF